MGNILDGARELMEQSFDSYKDEEIKKALYILKKYRFNFVIAGGYARDKFYGREPKDCDICVYNFNSADSEEGILFNKMIRELQRTYATQLLPEYEEGDSRLGMVIKLDRCFIDIIFYRKAKTVGDVLSQFDCNMNQFYLPFSVPKYDHHRGQAFNLDTVLHATYANSGPTEFRFLTNDLSNGRILKMAAKWSAYTGKGITDGLSHDMIKNARAAVSDSAMGDIPF